MATLALWLQELPGIPEGIDDPGMLAVLFVLLVFLAFAVLMVRQLPKALGPVIAALDRLMTGQAEMKREIESLKGKIDLLERQTEGFRSNLHDRVTPAIAGLSIAALRRADLDDLAEHISRDNPDAIPPPEPRRLKVRKE